MADHVATKYLDWTVDDFRDLDCDELLDLLNKLIKELDSRDKDFKKNKRGYDYDDRGYLNHVAFYERVQVMLADVQLAYELNCGLTSEAYYVLEYWETKAPAPLGHPGRKPNKSLFQRLAQAVRYAPRPIPIPGVR